jgi:acyl-CoA synthetase (AMP-forming)/AMP-acid ligase II
VSEFSTFTELALARAEALPGRTAFVFLRAAQGGLEPERISYRALDGRAKRIASWLQERGAQGERVLVLQSSGPQFAASFLGCLYAGAVAVPVPPPGGTQQANERILGIVKDAGIGIVLTDSGNAPDVSRQLASCGHGDVPCLAVDRPGYGDKAAWTMPEITGSSLAFIQYTSGSTSEPKGVMVAHRNLLANQEAIQRAMGTGPESVIGGWLPFHHDMGLVGHLLHPLWLGATGVLMPPGSFVRHPSLWLRMVSDYRVTCGGGPNFAYELCLQRVRDEELAGVDLSSWTVAVNGAEPVRTETMRAFSERFAAYGLGRGALYPCYGLAEATLLVTGGTPGRPPTELTVDAAALEGDALHPALADRPSRTLVSCGRALDFDVRIVDPLTHEAIPEGRVGEIWVRGASIARGYWNRPAETEYAFLSATADGEMDFLRTGDLGARWDGELFVTGRCKDLIIVAGRNLYPQDVERTVRQISSLFGTGAAFAVDQGAEQSEQVVMVQEVRTSKARDLDLPELAAAVQRQLSREFEIPARNVLLVRPGTVRRTTSGKLQRDLMRRMFLKGTIKPLHAVIDPGLRDLVAAGRGGGGSL